MGVSFFSIKACCCDNPGVCIGSCNSGLKLRKHCDTPPPDGYPDYLDYFPNDPEGPPIPRTHWRVNRCHRLLVYGVSNAINICNNRITNIGIEPDYCLVTNGDGSNDGGPFFVDHDDPESGLLDTAPFFYSDCLVGGWEHGTVSLQPTKQNVHDAWDCCKVGETQEPWEIPNGKYRMYILIRSHRSYLIDLEPSPNEIVLKNPESTSAVWLSTIWLSKIGDLEDCEFEEIERATCPVEGYPPECS